MATSVFCREGSVDGVVAAARFASWSPSVDHSVRHFVAAALGGSARASSEPPAIPHPDSTAESITASPRTTGKVAWAPWARAPDMEVNLDLDALPDPGTPSLLLP